MAFSTPVNHEHYYPNILAVREYVENLVSFCDKACRVLQGKIDEDERKNESLERDRRKYDYKQVYGTGLRVFIMNKSGAHSTYDNESAFRAAATSGRLNDVTMLEIDLSLSFGRGIGDEIDEHHNKFSFSFKPYEIKFTRDSNFSNPEMDELEEQLIKLLEDFPATKTIFTPE